jgi:hypothetical protein
MRNWKEQPFRNSLSALAAIAMREVGAEGYAYLGKELTSGALQRLDEFGAPIPDDALTSANGVRPYQLGADAFVETSLAFTFSDPIQADEAGPRLDPSVETIRIVWAASEGTKDYWNLIGRVSELETRLLDAKIADRARGFLTSASKPNLTGAISKHVDTILRPTETRRLLESIIQQLEDEVEERRLAALAKGILQGTSGFTEEQAHAHLQALSRRSRRPLKDVAREVIAGRPVLNTHSRPRDTT